MRLINASPLLLLALAGCISTSSAPPPTVTIVHSPSADTSQVSPTPPPAPMIEQAPPPPSTTTRTVWQPGHWRYTGIQGHEWNWENGQYAAVPSGASAWVPGQWLQQNGQWVWQPGHWA